MKQKCEGFWRKAHESIQPLVYIDDQMINQCQSIWQNLERLGAQKTVETTAEI